MRSLDNTRNYDYGIVVFDGNNIIYKYRKMPFINFATTKGEHTGYVYGMLRFIISLWKKYGGDSTNFVICWDSFNKDNIRKKIDGEYKGNRNHDGDGDLFRQIDILHELLNAYGFCSIKSPDRYEADDLAYSIVESFFLKDARDIMLVSEDKDWEQMISDRVHVYKPKKKIVVTNPLSYSFEVLHSFVGDHCDNIKPVRGFSRELVEGLSIRYKTIDEVINASIAGKIDNASAILANKEALVINAQLLKLYLVEDVAGIAFGMRSVPNFVMINSILKSLEFSKLEQYQI